MTFTEKSIDETIPLNLSFPLVKCYTTVSKGCQMFDRDFIIERDHKYLNFANVITVTGLGAGALWLSGYGWPYAIISILADEFDGPVARALGETSEFGANLDWAGDMAMLGAVAMKLNMPWLIPALLPLLVKAHTDDPYDGRLSARAVLMMGGMIVNPKLR